MRILINAASAHMGGSVTYLENVLRWMPEVAPAAELIVYVPSETKPALPEGGPVRVRAYPYEETGGAARLYFDQVEIPRLIREEGADVLFSATGFGTFWSGVPEVLLVRNMAYFDRAYRALYRRHGKGLMRNRLRRWHSLLSIRRARSVLFPTRAVREAVEQYVSLTEIDTHVLHYGLEKDRLGGTGRCSDRSGRSWNEAPGKADVGEGPRILNVSTYAVHKNLETLIEALPALREAYPGLELWTTTDRARTSDVAEYEALQQRAEELGVREAWNELGYVAHERLSELYRGADLYVFPSATESFGHSLVEAMAFGLPIAASGTRVHREVCGDAAAYFETFDPAACAETIRSVLEDADRRKKLGRRAARRADRFSWGTYAEELAKIFRRTARAGASSKSVLSRAPEPGRD